MLNTDSIDWSAFNNQKPQQGNQQPQQKKEEKEINISFCPQTKEFPGLFATCITDTNELACLINNMIRPILPDLKGTKIDFNNGQPSPFCALYFTDNNMPLSQGQYRAIEPIFDPKKNVAKSTNETIQMILEVNQFNQNLVNPDHQRHFKLTKEAKKALSEIIPNWGFDKNNNKHILWDKLTYEGSFVDQGSNLMNSIGMPSSNIVYYSVAVDLYKIVKKIFGSKNKQNEPVSYVILPKQPLDVFTTPNGETFAKKWEIVLIQVKNNDVFKFARERGINMGQNNSLGIVTD